MNDLTNEFFNNFSFAVKVSNPDGYDLYMPTKNHINRYGYYRNEINSIDELIYDSEDYNRTLIMLSINEFKEFKNKFKGDI